MVFLTVRRRELRGAWRAVRTILKLGVHGGGGLRDGGRGRGEGLGEFTLL